MAFLVSYYMMRVTDILIFLADIEFVKQYILAFKGYLQLEDFKLGCRFKKFEATAWKVVQMIRDAKGVFSEKLESRSQK